MREAVMQNSWIRLASRLLALGLVAVNFSMAEAATPDAGQAYSDVPARGQPGKGSHRALAKDVEFAKTNPEFKQPPKRWSTPGGWSDQPVAAALLPTVSTMQAIAATLRQPLVSDLVAPPPWAAESCERWYREGWSNCMRLLDQDTRRILWQSVTYIENEQLDRAKRGARLQNLQLYPDQAKEILAYCSARASAWAQASNKSCP
jgi:hypothetical protein